MARPLILKSTLLLAFLSVLIPISLLALPFYVRVNALAVPDATNRGTYVLLPGNEGVSPQDLQFREFAALVKVGLERKGFVEVDNSSSPALAIFVSYGIGDPSTSYYTEPSYGITGGDVLNPEFGWSTQLQSKTSFFRFLRVDAFVFSASIDSEDMIPVWSTVVTSEGSSGDLRRVVPVLAFAASEYFSEATEKEKTRTINDKSKKMKAFTQEAKAKSLRRPSSPSAKVKPASEQ